ncbi:hypothetical protein [Metabacillus idriensis]|uniref:hypothetical protein n=1 Tax=Metabacillus idriensis TaxID=324768 RepID=UPI00174BC41C|nr:hypothetical protein [Metabacillus idriensis]
MKKKNLLSFILAALVLLSFTIGGSNASAATLVEQSGVDLGVGESSATSSRVTVKSGQELNVNIYYYYGAPKKATTYKIFKNGVEWYSGTISGTTRYVEKVFYPSAGEYSVRHYNTSTKDVSAYGGIQVYQ